MVVERKTQREHCPSSTDGTSSSAWDRHLQETGESHLYKNELSRQRQMSLLKNGALEGFVTANGVNLGKTSIESSRKDVE